MSVYKYISYRVDGGDESSSEVLQDIELLKIPSEQYERHEMTDVCCSILNIANFNELVNGCHEITRDQVKSLFQAFKVNASIKEYDNYFSICGHYS